MKNDNLNNNEINNKYKTEIEKLRIEIERNKIEKLKAWMTMVSIVIPLFITFLTILYGIRSQNERAKIDFELKSAEIVMNAQSSKEAMIKAEILTHLFPHRLSSDFYHKFKALYNEE